MIKCRKQAKNKMNMCKHRSECNGNGVYSHVIKILFIFIQFFFFAFLVKRVVNRIHVGCAKREIRKIIIVEWREKAVEFLCVLFGVLYSLESSFSLHFKNTNYENICF